MANKRIFYAIQQVGLGNQGLVTFGLSQTIHGLQSVGISTRFSLEQIYEIGQLNIYQDVEALPNIEVTLEKVLDGQPLIYHMATVGSTNGTINGRANVRTSFAMSVFPDTFNAASGTTLQAVYCSGMYLSSTSYTFPVEGSARESVSLVGNNKIWMTGSVTPNAFYPGQFSVLQNDVPAFYPPVGVVRRQHVLMGSGVSAAASGNALIYPSIFPFSIPDISGGLGNLGSGYNIQNSDNTGWLVHVQSIKVAANFGRDELVELGQKGPYWRYVNFPVEVRTDIEVISTQGDMVSATEVGVLNTTGLNLNRERIFVSTTEGTHIDLGANNILQNVTYGGGNAGSRGGNAMTTYSYVNFNEMNVIHPTDPTAALSAWAVTPTS